MSTTAVVSDVSQPVAARAVSRLAWGDYARVIGTVAVICQHVAHRSTLVAPWNPESPTRWSIMALEAACRWAVPVFVMLSGALLLDPDRKETPKAFYRKRFWRVGIPLVFWSTFYVLPHAAAHGFDRAVLAE